MKVTVLSGQTLTDIAMQVYGSAEGVFTLAIENGLDVTVDLQPGQKLTYQAENILERTIVNYYAMNGICPATAFVDGEGLFDLSFDYTFNQFNNEQNN